MSIYTDIQETLDSPGMKHVARALRQYHKRQWLEYKACKTEVDLAKIQTAQLMIDTVIPAILERLMNQHISEAERDKAKKNGEWWDWRFWFSKIRMRARR